MQNLAKETRATLVKYGKGPCDVKHITDGYNWCSWWEFLKVSDIDYDGGFRCAEINTSLKIVGDGWWLERGEYDGAEWWVFKTMPVMPELEGVVQIMEDTDSYDT